MKLLVVACIKEHKHTVSKILQASGISVFSLSDVTGYKRNNGNPNPMDYWFGKDNTEFDSKFFYAFTDDQNASTALNNIEQFNTEHEKDCQFPLHAFILPVEATTKKF